MPQARSPRAFAQPGQARRRLLGAENSIGCGSKVITSDARPAARAHVNAEKHRLMAKGARHRNCRWSRHQSRWAARRLCNPRISSTGFASKPSVSASL